MILTGTWADPPSCLDKNKNRDVEGACWTEADLSLDDAFAIAQTQINKAEKRKTEKKERQIERDGVGSNLEMVVGRYCKYL